MQCITLRLRIFIRLIVNHLLFLRKKLLQIIGLSEEALNALKTYKEVDDIAFSGLPKSCVSYRLSII